MCRIATAVARGTLSLLMFKFIIVVPETIYAEDYFQDVDVELVLAVDASASMDADEQDVQRRGYAQAIQAFDVVRAVRMGPYGRIALTYVEWGEPGRERVVVPWMIVATAEDAQRFASMITSAGNSEAERTSISSGLLFAARQFLSSPARSLRRVIDVSGDGPNNVGPPVDATRDRLVRQGIVINGLAITTKGGEGFGWKPWLPRDPEILAAYYRACVIGGAGAFVVSVDRAERFEAAIRQKLVLEISGLQPVLMRAAQTNEPLAMDCQVGEKNLHPFDPGHPKPFN